MANKENKNQELVNNGRSFLLNSSSPFLLKEAYKALRTNIMFSLPGNGPKVIGFTSDSRGEGKSTNAVNVALSFADIGKRVVIMDCDMRLPTVAKRFKLTNSPGLSDLIIGEAKPNEVVRNIRNNILVVPSGRIPKDPTRLLESTFIDELFKQLRASADYIFVDLPPVTAVADAVILARHIDGFVLVARHGVSEHKNIQEELRLLKLADAKILGFLYNDAPVVAKKNYKYYG